MFKFKLPELTNPSLNENALDLGGTPGSLSSERRPIQVSQRAVVPGAKTRLGLIAPILISVLLNIIGQFVLKQGMSSIGPISLTERSLFEIFWSFATNPFVIGGMVIYGGSVLSWLVGLSRVPLSYAYPFISLSYVVILAGSFFLLGEHVSLLRLAGVGVICFGVLLVAYSDPHNK